MVEVTQDEAQFLLVKRGLYYAPDNAGYTALRCEAGRYLETDARPDCGVTAVHEDEADEYAPACWPETKLADKDRQIAELQARLTAEQAKDADIAELRAKLEEAELGEEVRTYERDHAAEAIAERDALLREVRSEMGSHFGENPNLRTISQNRLLVRIDALLSKQDTDHAS